MINGARIRVVRELKGMTQEALAGHVNVAQSAIAQVESGTSTISEELAAKIAFKTGFPLSFFKQDDISDFPLGSLLFRAHSSIGALERAEVHGYGQVVFEMAERMARKVNEIPLRLPRVSEVGPAKAANLTRTHFGLSPDTPISHLINAVERAGVFVLTLPISLEDFDAFSLWTGSEHPRAVIIISSGKPGDRLRMTIAHELGHLVIHQAIKGNLRDAERAANAFAGEFLLPESAMRHEIVAPVTLTRLANLKMKWKVSIQALAVRAHELGIISDRQYRYIFEQISLRGWRKKEPESLNIAPERPRAVRKMAEILYGNPVDYRRLATDAHLSAQFVRDVIEAHAEKAGSTIKQAGASKRPVSFLTRN